MRTLCAWCRRVLVDVPEDARGVSHGICSGCVVVFAASSVPVATASPVEQVGESA
jgi:hypothetical protein